mgnify:CR=1 FL=1
MASILRAILEWLGSFIKSEVKQDVKAEDGKVDKELLGRVRDHVRKQLRDDKGRFRGHK